VRRFVVTKTLLASDVSNNEIGYLTIKNLMLSLIFRWRKKLEVFQFFYTVFCSQAEIASVWLTVGPCETGRRRWCLLPVPDLPDLPHATKTIGRRGGQTGLKVFD